MSMTTMTRDHAVALVAYQAATDAMAAGDRDRATKVGQLLAHRIKHGEGPVNAFAAVLEDLRANYRTAFGRPATTSVPGVRVNARTGRVHVAPEAGREEPAAAPIPQGTFTVEFAGGEYETVELETIESGNFAGRTIASYLAGQDNETSFQGFAFATSDGRVHPWKRFAGQAIGRKLEAVRVVLGAPSSDEYREAYAMRSGKCSMCHKKLTVPASLHRGMGPDCAKKHGA